MQRIHWDRKGRKEKPLNMRMRAAGLLHTKTNAAGLRPAADSGPNQRKLQTGSSRARMSGMEGHANPALGIDASG